MGRRCAGKTSAAARRSLKIGGGGAQFFPAAQRDRHRLLCCGAKRLQSIHMHCQILHIRWFNFVTNASVPTPPAIARASLDPSTPAHTTLTCAVAWRK